MAILSGSIIEVCQPSCFIRFENTANPDPISNNFFLLSETCLKKLLILKDLPALSERLSSRDMICLNLLSNRL